MLDVILAVLPFAVSMTATPGPNNVMVTASAANFGFRRTVPHILGVAIGFPVMLVAVGLGLGGVLALYPAIHRVLVVVGSAYLLFLAYQIATTTHGSGAGGRGAPLSFLKAALFQWVNPKAWIIALDAVATFTTPGGDLPAETVVIGGLFLPIALASLAIWAWFGTGIGRFLQAPHALKTFNRAMAALLAASLIPILL